MAFFYMHISSVSRGAGRRATAAAAYRSGERIRDERTGTLHNYAQRQDVLHTEIFLPEQFAGLEMSWARNRERLWNTAEHAEKRHNARVAREFQVTLPVELTAIERVALARTFAREVAERYRVAVDLAVHAPRAEGDPRNFHAHLLVTTREVSPAGLGGKAGLDIPWSDRIKRQLPDIRQEFVNVRERWAIVTNEALARANVAARVDHRSLAAQGIEREPLPAIPLAHLKMEQKGVRSEYAAHLREDYRQRVEARLARGAHPGAQTPGLNAPQDLEEVRRQAREAWLQLRARAAKAGRDAAAAPAEAGPRREDDQAL